MNNILIDTYRSVELSNILSEKEYEIFLLLYDYFNNTVRHEELKTNEIIFNIPLAKLGQPHQFAEIKNTLRSLARTPMDIVYKDRHVMGTLLAVDMLSEDFTNINESVRIRILS